jgi:hypothetical protein
VPDNEAGEWPCYCVIAAVPFNTATIIVNPRAFADNVRIQLNGLLQCLVGFSMSYSMLYIIIFLSASK